MAVPQWGCHGNTILAVSISIERLLEMSGENQTTKLGLILMIFPFYHIVWTFWQNFSCGWWFTQSQKREICVFGWICQGMVCKNNFNFMQLQILKWFMQLSFPSSGHVTNNKQPKTTQQITSWSQNDRHHVIINLVPASKSDWNSFFSQFLQTTHSTVCRTVYVYVCACSPLCDIAPVLNTIIWFSLGQGKQEESAGRIQEKDLL